MIEIFINIITIICVTKHILFVFEITAIETMFTIFAILTPLTIITIETILTKFCVIATNTIVVVIKHYDNKKYIFPHSPSPATSDSLNVGLLLVYVESKLLSA